MFLPSARIRAVLSYPPTPASPHNSWKQRLAPSKHILNMGMNEQIEETWNYIQESEFARSLVLKSFFEWDCCVSSPRSWSWRRALLPFSWIKKVFKFLFLSEKDAFYFVSARPPCALSGAPNVPPWQVLLTRSILMTRQGHSYKSMSMSEAGCVSRLQTETCAWERFRHRHIYILLIEI